MKMLQIQVLAVLLAFTVGCGKPSTPVVSHEAPPSPVVTGISIQEGEPVVVTVSMPGSKWQVNKSTPTDVAYVRINGQDHKCSIALWPFSSIGPVDLDLRKVIANPPDWSPGTYAVAYVVKDFTAVHSDDPKAKQDFKEFVSAPATVTITPKHGS